MRLTCTDHRIIEILGLRPSNRLPVSYYHYSDHYIKMWKSASDINGLEAQWVEPVLLTFYCVLRKLYTKRR